MTLAEFLLLAIHEPKLFAASTLFFVAGFVFTTTKLGLIRQDTGLMWWVLCVFGAVGVIANRIFELNP